MRVRLEIATAADAREIAALRCAMSAHLATQFGGGPWSANCTEQGVRYDLRTGTVLVARKNKLIVATLKLTTKKPWAIDLKYFHASKHPLYLTTMAVAPALQRTGLGRQCLVEAVAIAKMRPSGALRLDAYDAPAGAGDFYLKCGFREVGRASYRGTPLIYFERLL